MSNMENFMSSVTLFLKTDEVKKNFSVSQSKLSCWLKRYNKWLLEKNEKIEREPVVVDLYVLDPFFAFDKFVSLLETILLCKSIALIHVNFRDLIEHAKEMDVLKERNLFKIINIYLSEDDIQYRKLFDNEIKDLYKRGVEIHFLANEKILNEFNVFSSEVLNEKGLSIFPQQTCKPMDVAPRYPVCSCQKRLQLCVNEKGFIYPCQGLASIEKFAIGHVSDKNFDHYSSYKCADDDLRTLIEKGPSLKRLGKVVDGGFSWICRRHMFELTVAKKK